MSQPERGSEWPTPVYAWYVVAVLTLANLISLLDRQVLALLVEPVRAALNISDTGISILHGFAFALFFSLMALPIARWADVGSRRTIITIGIGVWSLMTAVCGLARNFWQLFVARMGVGVGEATLNPCAYSLLSDYFPPQRRALPMGVFVAGIPGGVGLSLIAGAAVIEAVAGLDLVSLPVVGALQPWQLVFVILGLLGLPAALLMLTVREPLRKELHARATAADKGFQIAEVAAFFKSNLGTYGPLFAGYALMVSSASGINAWTPTFYVRSYGLTAAEAGYLMGTVAVIGGPLGAIGGGALADWLQRRGVAAAKLKVLLGCAMLLPIPGILGPLMPTPGGALFFLFFIFLLGSATAPTTLAIIQEVTPNRIRAQATALLYFLVNLLGVGLGPFAVALVTDYIFRDDLALRYSMVVYSAIAYAAAIVLLGATYKAYKLSFTQPALR